MDPECAPHIQLTSSGNLDSPAAVLASDLDREAKALVLDTCLTDREAVSTDEPNALRQTVANSRAFLVVDEA